MDRGGELAQISCWELVLLQRAACCHGVNLHVSSWACVTAGEEQVPAPSRCDNLRFEPFPGPGPSEGQSEAFPGHEVVNHRVQGEQESSDTDAREALPGAAPGLQQRRARHQEEARAAQDGRGQPGLRPLSLVVGTAQGTRCHQPRAACRGERGRSLPGSF